MKKRIALATADCCRGWGWLLSFQSCPERTPAHSRHPQWGTQMDKSAVEMRHGAAWDRALCNLGRASNPTSLPSDTCNALQNRFFNVNHFLQNQVSSFFLNFFLDKVIPGCTHWDVSTAKVFCEKRKQLKHCSTCTRHRMTFFKELML